MILWTVSDQGFIRGREGVSISVHSEIVCIIMYD